jgi:hypothetical protein
VYTLELALYLKALSFTKRTSSSGAVADRSGDSCSVLRVTHSPPQRAGMFILKLEPILIKV